MALVKSSFPFLTCSALSPPVMIWMVAINIITNEMAPAVPARNWRSAMVKPLVSTLRHPRAVLIAVSPQLPFGSIALMGEVETRKYSVESTGTERTCVRMDIWFLSGKSFFIS